MPCVIFDGRSEDFAAEMFVIINSTPTRINKSHLVDLYERVSWADPDRRFAARLVEDLYSEDDSPLQYRINRLGGRSQQDKWILQAELFNELHRWVSADWKKIRQHTNTYREGERYYGVIRDFFKAAPGSGATPGATTLHGHQAGHDQGDGAGVRRPRPRRRRPGRRPREALGGAALPWTDQQREFRSEGFYERFPAKGQIERVARIHRDLAKWAEIEIRSPAKDRD